MDWETLYQPWRASCDNSDGRRKSIEAEVRAAVKSGGYDGLAWDLEALPGGSLEHASRAHFIRVIVRHDNRMPDAFLAPLVRAAIYERDPSFNRHFVEPCLRCFGLRRTNDELLRYATAGSDFEKAGAANAFYWSLRARLEGKPVPGADALDGLSSRVRDWRLTEFVSNPDVSVRRVPS